MQVLNKLASTQNVIIGVIIIGNTIYTISVFIFQTTSTIALDDSPENPLDGIDIAVPPKFSSVNVYCSSLGHLQFTF